MHLLVIPGLPTLTHSALFTSYTKTGSFRMTLRELYNICTGKQLLVSMGVDENAISDDVDLYGTGIQGRGIHSHHANLKHSYTLFCTQLHTVE